MSSRKVDRVLFRSRSGDGLPRGPQGLKRITTKNTKSTKDGI